MRSFFEKMFSNDGDAINGFYLLLVLVIACAALFGGVAMFEGPRWQGRMDMDRDGAYSFLDLWAWLLWIFAIPGDFLTLILDRLPLAGSFFGTNGAGFGSIFSCAASLGYWWLVGSNKFVRFWVALLVITLIGGSGALSAVYGSQ